MDRAEEITAPADFGEARRTELLTALDEIGDVLQGCAVEAEAQRTLPEAAWRAIDERRLFALKAPSALGGFEADPLTQLDVYERAAYLDSSAGWAITVGTGSLGIVSCHLPDAGLAAFVSGGRLPRAAGTFIATKSTALRVEGGYRLSGRWPFASGCRHAEWLFAIAVVDSAESPVRRAFVFPASSARLLDTWHVSGLRGTGSDDFEVTDLFVPDALTFDPQGPPQRGGRLFALGLPGFVANEHAGFALGVARRAIDEALDLAKHKARGSENPQLVAGRPVFQHEIGGLDIELLAARALVRELYGTAWSRVLAGEPVADEWQMRIRAAAVHATDVALAVTRAAFRHGGGQALRAGSMLDRCLRDTQAAAQHLFVDQAAYQLHGERLLRLPQGGAPA